MSGTDSALGPDPARAAAWTSEGTALLAAALPGPDLRGPSLLPGWTRAHVVAHLALNAEALGRLAVWARTGVPTPMYSSAEQRDADIATGARRPDADLLAWSARAALEWREVWEDVVQAGSGSVPVRTAQGREVPFAATAWMRAREVLVHAVDLDAGIGFADLPGDFLDALVADVRGRRGPSATAVGPRAPLAAYLTGRLDAGAANAAGVQAPDGTPPPALGPWL